MPEELWSALTNDVGTKRAIILAIAVVFMLLGSIGWASWLASARPSGREATAPPRRFLGIASALLLIIGVATLMGVGVIIPLGTMERTSYALVNIDRKVGDLGQQSRPVSAGDLSGLLQDQMRRQESLVLGETVRAMRELLSRPRYRDPKRLNRHELRVCSQNGEDGVIAEIFRRIGTTNRYFVEFGAADGSENNTVLLLRQGWSGLWIEADPDRVAAAKTTFANYVADGKLTVLQDFITAENIEDLFRKGKVPEEFDLLSVDIDRNDYYVWEKITRFRPRAAVLEYNAGIPPTMSWVVPYDPKAFGNQSFGSGNGASLKALEELGTKKGYRLVGCELCGVNSFFVREELVGDHFAAPYTAANHFEPFRYPHIKVPLCDPSIAQDLGAAH